MKKDWILKRCLYVDRWECKRLSAARWITPRRPVDHRRRIRGAPVRLVLIVNSKPQFDLVGQPEIKSVPQLKGKVVGISSRGGAVDLLTQFILTHHGFTPNKDATLIVIGTPEEFATALRTGHIAACLLSPPRQLILYREGFIGSRIPGITSPVIRRAASGQRKKRSKTIPPKSSLLSSQPQGASIYKLPLSKPTHCAYILARHCWGERILHDRAIT